MVAALIGAALVLLVWAQPAHAAAIVDRQAWARTGPLGPVGPQAGHLYVSVAAGQEQARSYLHVAATVTDEAALDDATIALAEASDGLMADQGALAACALTTPVSSNGELTGQLPGVDCSLRASLARAQDGTWSLPLAVFAHALASGERQGLAIVPDLDTASPATFTVSFDAARTQLQLAPGAEPAPTSPFAPAEESAPAAAPAAVPVTTPHLSAPVPLPLPPPAAIAESRAPAPAPVLAAPRLPQLVRRAASPPALVVLVPVLLAGLLLWARGRWLPPALLPGATVPTGSVARVAGWGAVGAFALLSSEATAYKLGFIAIVFVGAIGLHILVNWSGELSLAHAGFIGLPAFAVAQLSAHSGVSPILVLPFGIVVGALLGLVVAIPALRARGLQVALVTLAVGIAIGQFFFVRTWVIGSSAGIRIPVPTLLGVRFETSRSLLPVLAVVVLVAVLAARAILDSKVGRALSAVRANPDAAAAAGIPVAFYRGIVYAIAGAFAGLAGSSYVLWVQRVSPKAFPLDLGFTYLVIAVLAGRGGLTGLGLSAVFLEGGRLFSILPEDIALYLGPIALIYNVTRYQEGINGVLRELRHRWRDREGMGLMERRTAMRLPVIVASLLIVGGFAAMVVAWYHAGNTDQLWIQNQEIVSGGLGGLGLIVLGSMLLVRDALLQGRAFVSRQDDDH